MIEIIIKIHRQINRKLFYIEIIIKFFQCKIIHTYKYIRPVLYLSIMLPDLSWAHSIDNNNLLIII